MDKFYTLLFILLFYQTNAFCQQDFLPNDGDRIILLGNALIENEQQFGFLEYGLTNYWPDKHLTFRNLGWSGDTVFGEARSYYTNPPGPYDLLISQIKASNPDWAIIGYGNVEAQEGSEGLEHFKNGLNQLIDSVEALGAKVLLLSTIPQVSAGTEELLIRRNKEFLQYNQAIEAIAKSRTLIFIDIFNDFTGSKQVELYENDGVHLNEEGYLQLTSAIMTQLKLETNAPTFVIDASTSSSDSKVPVENISVTDKSRRISFDSSFPAPLKPISEHYSGNEMISIKGMRRGNYSLSIGGKIQAIASRKDWEEGVFLKQSPSIQQSEQLLELIREKDKIYFQQYRPQNRTYIIGFRSYEQGRHKEGLAALDALIQWLDDQINLVKKPQNFQYLLERLP